MISSCDVNNDGHLNFDGEDVSDVICVGKLVARHQENMRTIFEVDDGTASFNCIFYQKGENEVPIALKNLEFTEGMYARIYGTIRVFKEERGLVGSNIQAITNHNEVTNHLLKVFTA